jgi:hypothetical protein
MSARYNKPHFARRLLPAITVGVRPFHRSTLHASLSASKDKVTDGW